MSNRNTAQRVCEIWGVETANDADVRLIRLHCNYLARTGATDRTVHHRRENLRRLAESLPGLLTVTGDQLDDHQAALSGHVSLSSLATYKSHWRGFYSWAIDCGYIDVDPTARLPRTRVPKRPPRPIPPDDFEEALACAPEPIYCWLVLGAYMGLRAGEVARIRREDVTTGELRGKPRLFLAGLGKGAKPYRMPVPVEVEPVLRPYLDACRSGPLWTTRDGDPIRAEHVTGRVSRYFEKLGMKWTMHNTRHTFGTEVQKKTRDVLQTRNLMRHENVQTTQQYVEPVDGPGVIALDRLSAQLGRRRARRQARGSAA